MAKKQSKEEKLREIITTATPPTSMVDLMESIIKACGGLDYFAAMFKEELDKAPIGSQLRKQWAVAVLNGVKAADENATATDMGSLSDEDIDREIKRQLAELRMMDDGEAAGPTGGTDELPDQAAE